MALSNPYTMQQTINKLNKLLSTNNDAIALLDKALEKAKTDKPYAKQFEDALLNGSTIECREVFSAFGEYFKRSETFPWYPQADAVNSIDTALYYVKLGFIDQNGFRREVPDMHDYVSLEISAVIVDTLHDGTREDVITALFGVASGKLTLDDLVDEHKRDLVFFTVYARDDDGFAKAIHDSHTLEQAQAVAGFIKGCNNHLGISLN